MAFRRGRGGGRRRFGGGRRRFGMKRGRARRGRLRIGFRM